MMQSTVNEHSIDAIKEIVNISSGNAATALSEMTNCKVDLNIPYVKYLDITEIASSIGNEERPMSCVYLTTTGDIRGYMLFITDHESYKNLASQASGGMDIEPDFVISEVVNIINGSYLQALSQMLDFRIDLSPPEHMKDMLGAILSSFVGELSLTTNESILISSQLAVSDSEYQVYQLFLMEEESLHGLLETLREKYSV